MKIVGHADYKTTANIYTHVRDKMLKKATVYRSKEGLAGWDHGCSGRFARILFLRKARTRLKRRSSNMMMK